MKAKKLNTDSGGFVKVYLTKEDRQAFNMLLAAGVVSDDYKNDILLGSILSVRLRQMAESMAPLPAQSASTTS